MGRVYLSRGRGSGGSRFEEPHEDRANVLKLDGQSQGSEPANPRAPEPRPRDYFGVSRVPIHSVKSTCRMAAVGTARMAPGIPSSLPPISSAVITVTAL